MGKRVRLVGERVTNSPASSRVVLMSLGGSKPFKTREIERIQERKVAKAFSDLTILNGQYEVRERLLEAAIARTEKPTQKAGFMAQSEITSKTNDLNNVVKVVMDADGIHFTGRKKRKKMAVSSTNGHGTESSGYVFRDNITGDVVGKSTIKTNKIW